MADEIIRLDYSAEDIGDNIDEVRTARGTFDTLDDRLDNIESGGPSPSNPIASNCVSPMTGYSKSSSSTPGNISTDDTLNAAIGKLEKRTELNENNISSLRAYGGLKNYATINNGTYTANSGGGTHSIPIPLLGPITGDIVISIGNITSNDVDSSTCSFVFENDITSRETVAVSRGNNINVLVSMGTFVATKVQIYPAASYQTSGGDTVSWTDLMICTKEDWDNSHDYQPYAMSNAELTAKEQTNKNNILFNTFLGRKNALKLQFDSSAISAYGLTFTKKADGTLTVLGAYNGSAASYAPFIGSATLPAGTYMLSGCPSGGGESTWQLDMISPSYVNDAGNGAQFTLTQTTIIQIRCRIATTEALSKTFYPMITLKSIYDNDSTFERYAMSNAEITDWIETQ